jgi:hypothetical protein
VQAQVAQEASVRSTDGVLAAASAEFYLSGEFIGALSLFRRIDVVSRGIPANTSLSCPREAGQEQRTTGKTNRSKSNKRNNYSQNSAY